MSHRGGGFSVYLAARFDHQAEMRRYREELERIGISVTSRWLDEPSNQERIAQGKPYTDLDYADLAMHDLEDVRKADLFVAFTESPDVGYTSGGRHVEYGFALALIKPTIICGPIENIFHRLGFMSGNDITICETWHDALIEIARFYAAFLRGEPLHAAA